MTDLQDEINQIIEKIKMIGGKKVRFIILYGSFVTGKKMPLSDIDIAVYYDDSVKERFTFRMNVLGRVHDKFDIQTFQDLPLYVQREVLRGKVIYYDNNRFLYDIIRKTSQDFDDFKLKLYDYIRGGVIA